MKIIRSEILGFCMGVQRAVERAEELVDAKASGRTAGGGIYTLGELIHNPLVLEKLGNKGVKILSENEIPPENSTVIIRAHGVSPQIENLLRDRGIKVIDTTCPHVKANQRTARELSNNGLLIFLAGEKNHAELSGIKAHLEDVSGNAGCIITGNKTEAENAAEKLFKKDKNMKTALIGQTTINPEEYQNIGRAIKNYFPDLKIVDTICRATEDRQNALRVLCEKAEAVLIIGGKNSANTRELFHLAESMEKPSWLIESPEEIPHEICSYSIIGLAAGASTPASLIDDVENAAIHIKKKL